MVAGPKGSTGARFCLPCFRPIEEKEAVLEKR